MLLVSPHFSIPEGFRFNPTKDEIITFYLRPAINGQPLPCNILLETELYGGEGREPWNLFDKDAEASVWVFTKLRKKSKSRIDRTAGSGCWLGRCSKEITDAAGQVLGFDKYFTFTCKKDASTSSGGNGQWIMHEFSLADQESDYVICEIKNKDAVDGKTKKRKTLDVVADVDRLSVPTVKRVCADHPGNAGEEANGSSLTANPHTYSQVDLQAEPSGMIINTISFHPEILQGEPDLYISDSTYYYNLDETNTEAEQISMDSFISDLQGNGGHEGNPSGSLISYQQTSSEVDIQADEKQTMIISNTSFQSEILQGQPDQFTHDYMYYYNLETNREAEQLSMDSFIPDLQGNDGHEGNSSSSLISCQQTSSEVDLQAETQTMMISNTSFQPEILQGQPDQYSYDDLEFINSLENHLSCESKPWTENDGMDQYSHILGWN